MNRILRPVLLCFLALTSTLCDAATRNFASGTASSVATLSNLVLSAGTLNPVFSSATTNYNAAVPNAVSSIKLTPTATDAGATITVNGTPVVSGSASAAIPLSEGNNTITTIVTASDAISTQTYTVTVTRAAAGLSTNAILVTIIPSHKATLTAVTGPAYRNYTGSVRSNVDSIRITPTAQDATATIKVNGQLVASGSLSQAIPLNLGANTITITATAQDGATIKDYIVTLTRPISSTATLATLATTPKVALTAVTGPGYRNFTASVPNLLSSIRVTPTAEDTTATITVNGQAVNSGVPSQAIPLNVWLNTITTAVTAKDGITIKNYIISVTRAASPIATLSSMTLSTGVLNPTFASATTNYSVLLPNSTALIRVKPTVTETGATVKVNGIATASGSSSALIPLNVGANTITIIVTAPDGTTTNTYTVTATRAASDLSADATLYNIVTVNPHVLLTLTTGPGYRNYTTSVPGDAASMLLYATPNNSKATIKVNGEVEPQFGASEVPLKVGTTTIIIEVTAEDGATVKNYVIYVLRPPTLSGLAVNTGTYTNFLAIYVTNVTTSIIFTPTAGDAGSTIKIAGVPVASGTPSAPIALAVGGNAVNIEVTSQDGTTTKTYTINVYRADASKSTNAVLSSIVLIPATTRTPTTGPGYRNYTASVPYSVSSVRIVPTAQDATATIIVRGEVVASGNASGDIPLYLGISNNIAITVRAQDDATIKTYIIAITRTPSNNANLTLLELSAGTLSPAFSPTTFAYSAAVPHATSSLDMSTAADNAADIVTVNGVTVTGIVGHSTINLVDGSNLISIVVKTADGTVSNTYTVNITRAVSGLAMKYEEPLASPVSQTVAVNQSLSPNGDGKNDVLTIEGIASYPDNKLQIMNRSGQLIFQVKGYDNLNKTFDGQSNINGKLQPSGTYYYSLEYKDGKETKRKTGFIVLKY